MTEEIEYYKIKWNKIMFNQVFLLVSEGGGLEICTSYQKLLDPNTISHTS